MAVRSKRIDLHVSEKIHLVNPENLSYLEKYKIDLAIRDRAETTKYQYECNLKQ